MEPVSTINYSVQDLIKRRHFLLELIDATNFQGKSAITVDFMCLLATHPDSLVKFLNGEEQKGE